MVACLDYSTVKRYITEVMYSDLLGSFLMLFQVLRCVKRTRMKYIS